MHQKLTQKSAKKEVVARFLKLQEIKEIEYYVTHKNMARPYLCMQIKPKRTRKASRKYSYY